MQMRFVSLTKFWPSSHWSTALYIDTIRWKEVFRFSLIQTSGW